MTDVQTTAPRWRRVDPGIPGWVVAAAVVWGLHGFQAALSRDAALYVYAGQAVADGSAPYVDVLNRAGPLAHLLPGLGIAVGRATGVDEVVAVRLVFFALLVATPALTYVLARDAFGSRPAGSVAAACLLAFEGLALTATAGPQSKQPMMVGLLVALLLLTRERWLAAGVVTGLATLTWQPVLAVLVPCALLVAWLSPGERRARLVGLGRFGAGGLLTLAATAAYFQTVGAFDAFIEGFWGVNATHTDQQGLLARPEWAWRAMSAWLGWTAGLLVVGAVLSIVLGLLALRRPRSEGVMTAALGTATLTGLGWSVFAFNGAPDALLFLPLTATGVGGGAALLIGLAPQSWRRMTLGVVAAGTVAVLAATLHLTWTERDQQLVAERTAAAAVFADVPADATVFAHDAPQPLALIGRASISRYVLFGEGMEAYVASHWSEGIQGYVDHLQEQRPDVVVTSPRGLKGVWRPLARHYVEVDGGVGWRAFTWVEKTPRQRVVSGRELSRGAQ